MTGLAERLWHYERAVQQPEASVTLIESAYLHAFGDAPTRLREDFAGSAAIAAAWVRLSDDHRALAVDHDEPTAHHAADRIDRELGDRAEDCPVVCADVTECFGPRVDAVATLNFSISQWHDRPSLIRYLRHARRCLDGQGVIVIDTFGGPGSTVAPRRQRRRVRPTDGDPFIYVWEQRRFDPLCSRIECAIHFETADGRELPDAFAYDWRLWSPHELAEALREAGFDAAHTWAATPQGLRPVEKLPPARDWVAYLVGVKGL
ncbi:MAG: class I SAM-dependent methyltransferase [Planctomycetota bacterium]